MRVSMQQLSERQSVQGEKLSPARLMNSAGKKREAYGIHVFLQACITTWIPMKQSEQCSLPATQRLLKPGQHCPSISKWVWFFFFSVIYVLIEVNTHWVPCHIINSAPSITTASLRQCRCAHFSIAREAEETRASWAKLYTAIHYNL